MQIAVQPDNPQHVAEYVPDIFRNLQREEALTLPSPSYMDRQAQIRLVIDFATGQCAQTDKFLNGRLT